MGNVYVTPLTMKRTGDVPPTVVLADPALFLNRWLRSAHDLGKSSFVLAASALVIGLNAATAHADDTQDQIFLTSFGEQRD